MMEAEFPEVDATVDPVTAETLRDWLVAGREVTILDTRASSDYEAWRIDGPTVTSVNVPYFEFLDGLTPELRDRVPAGDPLVTVCAKGQSSEYVAELLAADGRDATNLDDGMRGWARIYEHVDVELSSGTLVRQYHRPSSGCLAYMVVADGEAAVVDPLRAFTERYREDAAELDATIVTVFDTHVHADHVSGLRELADAADAWPAMSRAAIDRGVVDRESIRVLEPGETVAVGDAKLATHPTPGHTSGMTSVVVDDELALTGDAVFLDGVARPDLEEGETGAADAAAQLYETLHDWLLALDDDTLVGPAHAGEETEPRSDGAYLARVGDLAEDLALLQVDESTFVERVAGDVPPRPANYQDIIATNLGHEDVDDEAAFTMELGPNNCAAGD